MAGLADFLKTSLDDSLKKLVQPAGLIPGALLVLLNLAFILPAAAARGVPVAVTFSGLAEATKIVVVAVLIPLIGFLFANGTSAVLDLFTGESWRESMIGRASIKFRNHRRDKLEEKAVADPSGELKWRLRSRYPREGDCAPTALGDVIRAFEDAMRNRHGLQLAALWEPLRAVVPDSDAAGKAVADEKSSLESSATLTLAGALFVAEAVVLFALWQEWSAVVVAAAGLLLVAVAYRVTVAKAVSWSDAVGTVVTLYIGALLEKLGTTQTSSLSARRRLLDKLSEFILREGSADGIFETPTSPTSVTASEGIKVEMAEASVRTPAKGEPDGNQRRESIDHVLLVSRTGESGDFGVGVRTALKFTDTRFPRMSVPVAHGAPLPVVLHDDAGRGDTLLWDVPRLRPGEGRMLRFELDRWRVEVTAPLTVGVNVDESTLELTIENPAGAFPPDARLTVFHAGDRVLGRLRLLPGPDLTRASIAGADRVWTLPAIPPDSPLQVALLFEPYDDEEMP